MKFSLRVESYKCAERTDHLGCQLRRGHGERSPPLLVLEHDVASVLDQERRNLLVFLVGGPVQGADALSRPHGIHFAPLPDQRLGELKVAPSGGHKEGSDVWGGWGKSCC